MCGKRTFTVVSFLVLVAQAATAAAVPDYFPLFPGNVWVYRGGGTRAESTLIIEVGNWEVFQGRAYFRLQVSPEEITGCG